MSEEKITVCLNCGISGARLYELYAFTTVGESVEPQQMWLCVRCTRRERRALQEAGANQLRNPNYPRQNQLTRDELISQLDRFWEESGAGEICRRCHEQGTGCCPPMCRYLGSNGCQKKNVFCTSFVCSALLNAISECDSDAGRLVKWVKSNPGSSEFRVYEMVTRVPAIDREQVRPLALPSHYPGPLQLLGEAVKNKLLALSDEVLEIRRRWHEEEEKQVAKVKKS